MSKSKKDKLEMLKVVFLKKKVLNIKDLFKVIGTTSRMTIHRYLKEMDYIVSYSHKGQYYTLNEIAQFDAQGLWHYDDIGFSKNGTLFETIIHLVERSESGMTSSELATESRTLVKYALLDLVERKTLSRAKPAQVYVYLSPDAARAEEQLRKRQKMIISSIDDETALRVLLVAYRLVEGTASPDHVANILKKEGSKISLEVVQQVFQHYELGKKTLDSASSQS